MEVAAAAAAVVMELGAKRGGSRGEVSCTLLTKTFTFF